MTRRNLFFGLLSLAAIAACDSSSPNGSGQISFSVASGSSSGAAGPSQAAADSMVDGGGNVLVLTSVELVLRDIEFRRRNQDGCDSLTTASDDDCEGFEGGPVLVDLPLDGGVSHEFSIAVDSGTFDELRLKVHKPEDDGDSRDRAFLVAHPDLEDVSIRVTGTFNGTAFTFESDLNADQEFALTPPMVVSEGADVEVTLMVDLSTWFVSGSALLDPALAVKGGPLEGVVKSNIEASFEAFGNDR